MRKKQSEEVAEVEKKHNEILKKSEVLNELCQKIKQKQDSFDNKYLSLVLKADGKLESASNRKGLTCYFAEVAKFWRR